MEVEGLYLFSLDQGPLLLIHLTGRKVCFLQGLSRSCRMGI